MSTGEHTAAPGVPALRYLCMFELQLSQLHQVLPERRHSPRLEVDEL